MSDTYSAASSSFEWFWCDDVEPTQADDLAAYTVPSTVWNLDTYYTRETWIDHSDWEEWYTDDYFDEAAQEKPLKPKNESGQQATKGHVSDPERKRKRTLKKHHVSRRYPGSIRGTILRSQRRQYGEVNTKPENLNYKPGEGDKISFLEDWRKVFRGSQPQSDKLREEIYEESLRTELSPRNRRRPAKADTDSKVTAWMENQEMPPKRSKEDLETLAEEKVEELQEHVRTALNLDDTEAAKQPVDDTPSATSEQVAKGPKKRKAAIDEVSTRSVRSRKMASMKKSSKTSETPRITRASRTRKT